MKNVFLSILLALSFNLHALTTLEANNFEFTKKELEKARKDLGKSNAISDWETIAGIVNLLGLFAWFTDSFKLGPPKCLKWYSKALKRLKRGSINNKDRYNTKCLHKKAKNANYNLVKSCTSMCRAHDKARDKEPIDSVKSHFHYHRDKQKEHYGNTELSDPDNLYTEYLFNEWWDFGKYDMYRCIKNAFIYHKHECSKTSDLGVRKIIKYITHNYSF